MLIARRSRLRSMNGRSAMSISKLSLPLLAERPVPEVKAVLKLLPVVVERPAPAVNKALRLYLGPTSVPDYRRTRRSPASRLHSAAIRSIRFGSLFLTLPTRGLTGQQVIFILPMREPRT
jgi:hypothetical protein